MNAATWVSKKKKKQHCADWEKLGIKEYVLYNFIHIKLKKILIKTTVTTNRSVVACLGYGLTSKAHEGSLEVTKIFCLDLGGDPMSIYIYQDRLKCALQWVYFIYIIPRWGILK